MRSLFAILIGFLPLVAISASGSLYFYEVRENSWIALSGTTNVNSFTCVSEGEIPRGSIVADVLPGSNAIYFSEAELELAVSSFDCHNRMMNKDLHESMGGKNHPSIHIELVEIRPHESVERGSEGKVRASLAITMNGKTKHTDLTVDFHQGNPFNMLISGSKELLMSDFGIDPPSPALGLVRVRDKVTIAFRLAVETSLITQTQ
ncbi:MAG: YceI family protein [Bacteroidales bacterium]